VISFRYNREILNFTLCILISTILTACLTLTIQKSQIAIAASPPNSNPIHENHKDKRDDITKIVNCGNLGMENKQVNNITVKKGDEFVITCKANRTAGYSLIPEFNQTIISLIDQKFQAASSGLLGSPGVYLFTFKAIKHGSDNVKILTRSAQNGGAIVDQKAYSIMVE
jgi:predicted secreted protein